MPGVTEPHGPTSSRLLRFIHDRIDDLSASGVDDNGLARDQAIALRGIVAEILMYSAGIDGQTGCSHSSVQIEAGLCPLINVDNIDALRWLGFLWREHPAWNSAWTPFEED